MHCSYLEHPHPNQKLKVVKPIWCGCLWAPKLVLLCMIKLGPLMDYQRFGISCSYDALYVINFFHCNLHLGKGHSISSYKFLMLSKLLHPPCKHKTTPDVLLKDFQFHFYLWSGLWVGWYLLIRNKLLNFQIFSFILLLKPP